MLYFYVYKICVQKIKVEQPLYKKTKIVEKSVNFPPTTII